MSDATIIREPLTYERHGEHSYFADLARATFSQDPDAEARLDRHSVEARVEALKRTVKLPEGMEYRTNPSRTTGHGGYFAPPLWLIDEFAMYPRAGRILADLAPKFMLPPGVQSVSLPRLTAGTSTASVVDLAPASETAITDAEVKSEVVTISGQLDVSLPLLEQSPASGGLDFAIWKDLTDAYDTQVETEILSGGGSGPELAGILHSGKEVEYKGEKLATKMYPALGETIATVSKERKMPPTAALLTTSRWAWLGSSEDKNERPFQLGDYEGMSPIGSIVGFPAYLDDAIPVNAAKEDRIIVCRPSDLMLMESEPHTSVMLDVLSGTLEARFQLHQYVAFLTRYPSSVAYLAGAGMEVASGF